MLVAGGATGCASFALTEGLADADVEAWWSCALVGVNVPEKLWLPRASVELLTVNAPLTTAPLPTLVGLSKISMVPTAAVGVTVPVMVTGSPVNAAPDGETLTVELVLADGTRVKVPASKSLDFTARPSTVEVRSS